jgi:hypothetical protein
MSDSSRKLSARTVRPTTGDAIVDARAFLAIEVRGGEERPPPVEQYGSGAALAQGLFR